MPFFLFASGAYFWHNEHMKMTNLFTKTRKEAPADEVSKNAQLLIRAGFIYKEMAGVYVMLPLGLRVLQNIISIIRTEINKLGGQEMFLTGLQQKSVWESTGRWNDAVVDIWFKTKLKNGTDIGLSTTHEEPLTNLMTQYINSYKDLPVYTYQFQTKFRNETRAKSGIMRTREFIMKDLYSFSRTKEEHDDFYERVRIAYVNIFNNLGLGDKTLYTYASGGSFAKYSHEFQTITDAGEDIVYFDKQKNIAYNDEIIEEIMLEEKKTKADYTEYKTSEIGNIFSLGTKFSDAFNLNYKDEDGNDQKVIMGSYGIGPARAMGIIVETLSDPKGIVWPKSIAPFPVHICCFGNDEEVLSATKKLTDILNSEGIEYLYDDRDVGVGEKLNDADLIGVPVRVVISKKSLEKGGYAVKERTGENEEIKSIDEIIAMVK